MLARSRAVFPVRVRHHGRRQHVRLASGRRTSRASSSCPTRRSSTPRSRSTRRSATTTIRTSASTSSFNMNGERYYTFKKQSVARSSRSTATTWTAIRSRGWRRSWRLRARTGRSRSSTIRCIRPAARMGPRSTCAQQIEPLFLQYGVNVVFAGHEHFYERIKPQKGIQYFTAGGSAKLRAGDIKKTDSDRFRLRHRHTYMLVGDRRRRDDTSRPSPAPASASTAARSRRSRRPR